MAARTGVTAYTKRAGAPGLRMDATLHTMLYGSGASTLRFDYGPVLAKTNLRTEIHNTASSDVVTVHWQRLRPDIPVRIAPNVTAVRHDAGAYCGVAPGRIWAAEVAWTLEEQDGRMPRRVIDLLEGAPEILGRLMLHRDPAGKDWSAP